MKIYRLLALIIAVCMVMSMTAFAGPPEMPEGGGSGGQEMQGGGPGGPGGDQGGSGGSGQQDPGAEQGGSDGESGGGAPGGPGGGGAAPSEYDAVLDITEDTEISGEELTSDNGSENVIHVFEGAKATITGCSFYNNGEGNGGDAASFYGVGATLLVSDGELFISDSDITSTTAGGTGVFAYDKGTAYVSGVTIRNSGRGGCGGIHAAGGGTLYAWDCDVETTGGSSAAIRSDRGGGLMVIDGGKYVSQTGTGAIYSTADISVHDAYLYAGASEAIAIEGKNSIRLFNCSLEGNMQGTNVNDNRVWNCIVYQSMSGDAEIGTSEFDMVDSELICHAGPVIFNTNTSSYITFKNTNVTYGDDTTYFLQVTGNSSSRTWGSAGKNGANCIFSAYEMEMEHDIMYDTISSLDMYLLEGTSWSGALLCDDSYNGGYSGDKTANVYIDASSTWNVTGDCVITGTLYLEGTVTGAQIVGTDGTVYVNGDGYTVIVGGFETIVDTSGAGKVPVWEDYAVQNPFA